MAVSAPELTTEQVQSILVKPLEAASTFLAAGPRIFDTPGRPVRIPKMGAATAPTFVAENGVIGEVDPDFDEIELLPSTLKSVKTITRFSNELARQSVVSLDAALKDRLVSDVASVLDKTFWGVGNGTSATLPRGIRNYAGQSTAATAGAVTLDDLHDAWALALSANVNLAGLRWAMTPATFSSLRKLKDGSQRYQLQPDPTADGVFRLLGAPVTITPYVGQGGSEHIVLADFSQIAVARDLAPSVTVLTERYADYDQQALRVVARYDVAPMNDDAVVTIPVTAA
ncbi:phage major capsid protein [Isoptericola sp. NPDC060257]|uniref:phage major capsid protein n=1 Tax=Isoptericola sp. NPDC060257 TaxID=3347087 RepID=UPI00365C1989